MTTSPVTEFLTARYDEEQRAAEAAAADTGAEHWYATEDGLFARDTGNHAFVIDGYGFLPPETGGFIARHDPARVLADIAAKRAIVEDYQIVMANNAIERANDGDELKIAARELIAKSLRMVLLRLAAPYADHPDFDVAWRLADV